MGLLDKALIFDNRPPSRKTTGLSDIINALQSTTTGLDFPTALFTKIKDKLGIKKGALLLPEEENVFVPWSETGLDQTTSRRIRIPQSIIENIRSWKDFNYLILKSSEIDIMRDYFSFREFSVTESIIISPLYSESILVSILFISEGDILSKTQAEQFESLNILSKEAGPILLKKRESMFNKMDDTPLEDNNKELAITQFIEQNVNGSFLLLSIKLNDFINFIMTKESNSISFRIKKDIFRLVKKLISNKGVVVNSINNSILILLNGNRIEEAELFVHQIGLSLSFFYKINSNQFNPDFTIKKFPEDGSSADELVKSLYT